MAFVPTDYPSLLGWYKADAIAQADASAVASWADSGPAGVALAQATGGNQPTLQTNEINGLAVVRFDGANDCLTRTLDLSAAAGITVYAVARPAQATATAVVMEHTANAGTTTGGFLLTQEALTGGHTASWYASTSISTTSLSSFESWTVPVPNTAHLVTIRLVYPARKHQTWLFVNGNGRGSPTTDVQNNNTRWMVSSTLNVGARNNGASLPFNGDLGEILIYGHVHRPEQRIAVEEYLAARWGIALVATDAVFVGSGHSDVDGAGPTTKVRLWWRRALLDTTANVDAICTARNGSTTEKFAGQRYPRAWWFENDVGKRILHSQSANNDIQSAFTNAKTEFNQSREWTDMLATNATHRVVTNVTDRQEGTKDPNFDTNRAIVNPWIASNIPAGITLLDYSADPNLGGVGAAASGALWSSDAQHYSDPRGEAYVGRKYRDSYLVPTAGLTAWTPAAFSGLVLWLKASAITGLADGDPVSTWTDSSGSGNSATATTTLRPTYKAAVLVPDNAGVGTAPAVRFNGTANGMVTPSVDLTGTSAITVFVAAAPANTTLQYVVWELSANSSTGTTGALVERTVTTALAAASVKGNVGSNGPSSSGSWVALGLIGALLDKTKAANQEVHQRFNGATFNSTGTNNNTNAYGNHPMYIGARGQASLFFDGDIAEVLVFNRALTPGEFRQVEMHLATKYGVW